MVLENLCNRVGDMQILPRGMMGYNHAAIVAGSGRVCWDDLRGDMGVHLSLPATALANLGVSPVSLLIDLYQNFGMKFTRIDLAGDDLKGVLSLDEIGKLTRAKNYVSRWDDWSFNENSKGGCTYYYGAVQSKVRLCIYDKAAERCAAGEDFKGPWVRAELRMKQERADKAARYIFDHIDAWQEWAAGLIKGYIDFKIPSADSNKSRWVTAPWWDEFLGGVSKERLTFSRGVRTIEESVAWFDHQLQPTLCAMQIVLGRDKVSDMIAGGARRMKAKHLAMIDLELAYRRGVTGEAE